MRGCKTREAITNGRMAGDAKAGSRQGERVGTAFPLRTGEIIYVPDGAPADHGECLIFTNTIDL